MRSLLVLTVLLLAVGAGAASGPSVAVAPFEQLAPGGESVPDVASRLADWLAASGVEKVVGPAQVGGPAVAEPSPAQVEAWARKAGVGAVVAGRTTRIGRKLSVDARVLAAGSGAALGPPIVVDVTQPQDLPRAIQSLTRQVTDRLSGASPPDTASAATSTAALAPATGEPAPPAAPDSQAAAPPAASPAPARRNPLDSKQPISIQSDQLEATEHAQSKHLIFTGNVMASQGDLSLRSDRLEAFYPPGGSSPDRLEATGHVVVSQPGRKATCEKAVYLRSKNQVVCTGKAAELTQDCDRVTGKTITFHLDTDILQVDGRADVRLNSGSTTCEPTGTADAAEVSR